MENKPKWLCETVSARDSTEVTTNSDSFRCPIQHSHSALFFSMRCGIMALLQRIQKELKEINSDPPLHCTAGPKGDNIYEWVATIEGPEGSPYESGTLLSL